MHSIGTQEKEQGMEKLEEWEKERCKKRKNWSRHMNEKALPGQALKYNETILSIKYNK